MAVGSLLLLLPDSIKQYAGHSGCCRGFAVMVAGGGGERCGGCTILVQNLV
jgi:hypothetical protein